MHFTKEKLYYDCLTRQLKTIYLTSGVKKNFLIGNYTLNEIIKLIPTKLLLLTTFKTIF